MKGFIEIVKKGEVFRCLVDPDIELEFSSKKLWFYSDGYMRFQSTPRSNQVALHRFITNASPDMVVDHINGDLLDCRRSNLRVCNPSMNQHNRHRTSKSGVGYYGVHKRGCGRSRYNVRIQYDNHDVSIGRGFFSPHVASLAVDGLRRCVLKSSHVTQNWPDSLPADSLVGFLRSLNGRLFTVIFSRRSDGSCRVINGRLGVNCVLTGDGPRYEFRKYKLLPVYDWARKEYRSVPMDRVLAVKANGRRYRVE